MKIVPHAIHNAQAKTYAVACDPLNDIYHAIEIEQGSAVKTGLPVLVYGATKADAYDKVFTEWTEDADGNLDSYTARETTLSSDYTPEDAEQTILDAQECCDGLMIRPIKHPDRDEWAMNVSTHILSNGKEGAAKDRLFDRHLDKINAGKNKSKANAKNDNWHKAK